MCHTHAVSGKEEACSAYQYGLAQAILCDVTLQMSRQLHGQRTYFFPTGAFFIGYREKDHDTPEVNRPESKHWLNVDSNHLTEFKSSGRRQWKCRGWPPIKVCWAHRGLVAYATLHHVLVRLALHRYGTLADPTVDDRSAAAVWAALRRVGRWRLAQHHRGGERRQTWKQTDTATEKSQKNAQLEGIRVPWWLTPAHLIWHEITICRKSSITPKYLAFPTFALFISGGFTT